MAAATTYAGQEIVLLAETLTANTYAAICAMDGKALNLQKTSSDTVVPDCDDPALPRWTKRRITAFSASINGTGILAREASLRLRQLFEQVTPQRWRFQIPGTGANQGGYWQGNFHLVSYEIGTEYGPDATVAIQLASDGPVTWTAAT